MNKYQYDASVIVSFYNNVDSLACIIKALDNQKENFEIIIADDGSREENVTKVKQLISDAAKPVTHIWQEDIGFRKNRILNKAVSHSSSDYLIFIDGDCIPQSHFVADHLSNKQPNSILNGRRVDLATQFKERLYTSASPDRFFNRNKLKIFSLYLFGHGKNVEKGIRITHPFLLKKLNTKKKGIVGCNFSLHKEDFLSVNGFDNRYNIPSIGEDTDIEYRLVKQGKQIKNLFYQAIVLHVIHTELPRLEQAEELFRQTREGNHIVALDGYHQAGSVD
ncbi:glycosyltransferase [Vibrio plantisponsor]|jgi:glycosyltransferase involved in cell wall biosynthesis|uniref:Glycosyltransferase n=1 Tax=Vibrio plantisponsor TaxID=664643 RepID=A0ABU4IID6_9VIBR|nr:glycosyltransferase [Vibrio plantisponsor]MDW6018320.1 glycosyltransferase [Vibrio plantisponsor]NNM41875.1 glycosyltransferase [Vibrio plantisponsor]